jgi:hypothetical protein
MTDVRRPAWWKYPEACENGHLWGPGRVIVSFVPCSCKYALAEPERGHLSVSCQYPGCVSRWRKPPHDESSVTWQVGRPGGLSYWLGSVARWTSK